MKKKTTTLSRLLCLMLAMLMTMSALSGCGKKAEETQSTINVPTVATTAPTEPPEIPYTPDLETGIEAVADIQDLEPIFRVENGESLYICRAWSTAGELIWLAVPTDVYYNAFADLMGMMDLVNNKITLSQALHIRGIVTDADELYNGLPLLIDPSLAVPMLDTIPAETPSQEQPGDAATVATEPPVAETTAAAAETTTAAEESTAPSEQTTETEPAEETTTAQTEPAKVVVTVLKVAAFEETALAAATGKNLAEEPYTASSALMAPVTAEIAQAHIAYTAPTALPEVACEAMTVDGQILWLYMMESDYSAYFGADGLPKAAILVKGIVRNANDLTPGLSAYSGQSQMILVKSCEIAQEPETQPTVNEELTDVVEQGQVAGNQEVGPLEGEHQESAA